VLLDDDPDGDLWYWNRDGELFADRQLTDPVGLTIVRLVDFTSAAR
jgi:hypothetical protein